MNERKWFVYFKTEDNDWTLKTFNNKEHMLDFIRYEVESNVITNSDQVNANYMIIEGVAKLVKIVYTPPIVKLID